MGGEVVDFELTYEYDDGGNRLAKYDWLANTRTDYLISACNNRPTSYTVVDNATGFIVEITENAFVNGGDAAGINLLFKQTPRVVNPRRRTDPRRNKAIGLILTEEAA